MAKINGLHVVGIVDGPEGPIMVDCAIRERDIDAEVLTYLKEKANETSAVLDEFEPDALGG